MSQSKLWIYVKPSSNSFRLASYHRLTDPINMLYYSHKPHSHSHIIVTWKTFSILYRADISNITFFSIYISNNINHYKTGSFCDQSCQGSLLWSVYLLHCFCLFQLFFIPYDTDENFGSNHAPALVVSSVKNKSLFTKKNRWAD